MRYRGRIVNWKDDRGFGFITPNGGEGQVFVHISSFVNRGRRPAGNEVVTYTLATDAQGRPQAREVSFVGDRSWQPAARTVAVARSLLIAAIFLLAVAGLAAAGRLPEAVLDAYLVASVIALLAYAQDKVAARKDNWRTPEKTLHLLGLAGGWPGALVARHVFRHKSTKRPFVVSFWLTVALNCGALVWMLSVPGQRFLASVLAAA